MRNNLYEIFIKDLPHQFHDLMWLTIDTKFEHIIGFDNSLKIRQTIYNDINEKFGDMSQNAPEYVSYKFPGEFFNKIIIYFEYVDNLFHDTIIMDKDVFIVDYDNDTKTLFFRIKCHHPTTIDFCKFRLGFLIGYYDYLAKNALNNEFVEFMDYILLNNTNRTHNSTNVFESAIKESRERYKLYI